MDKIRAAFSTTSTTTAVEDVTLTEPPDVASAAAAAFDDVNESDPRLGGESVAEDHGVDTTAKTSGHQSSNEPRDAMREAMQLEAQPSEREVEPQQTEPRDVAHEAVQEEAQRAQQRAREGEPHHVQPGESVIDTNGDEYVHAEKAKDDEASSGEGTAVQEIKRIGNKTGDAEKKRKAMIPPAQVLSATLLERPAMELHHENLFCDPASSHPVTWEFREFLSMYPQLTEAHRLARIIIPPKTAVKTDDEEDGALVTFNVVLGNDGEATWPDTTQLMLTYGHSFGLESVPLEAELPPSTFITLTLQLMLPASCERHMVNSFWASMWVLTDGQQHFGPLLILEVLCSFS